MTKDIVVKTNRLNVAFQALSLAEFHIVQLAIVDARSTGKGLNTTEPLRLDAMRYAEAFGTSRQTAYEMLKSAEENLFNRRFSFYDENGKLVKSRWIQQVTYLDGAIDLVFTLAVVQGISRIDGVKEFFTQYALSQTANLTSIYSCRLYELLIQYKSIGKTPVFELESFRAQLGIGENEYLRMDHFKSRVLMSGIKQINTLTDITVKVEQHKRGKAITGFSFAFKTKAKPAKAAPIEHRDPDTPDLFNKMTEKQIAKYSKELADMPNLSDLAEIGASTQQFAAQLASILRDNSNATPQTVARINAALAELGFKN